MGDASFWASFRNSLSMIVAMVVVPTLIGLLLAAVLFDYVGKHIGTKDSPLDLPRGRATRLDGPSHQTHTLCARWQNNQ